MLTFRSSDLVFSTKDMSVFIFCECRSCLSNATHTTHAFHTSQPVFCHLCIHVHYFDNVVSFTSPHIFIFGRGGCVFLSWIQKISYWVYMLLFASTRPKVLCAFSAYVPPKRVTDRSPPSSGRLLPLASFTLVRIWVECSLQDDPRWLKWFVRESALSCGFSA